MKQVEFERLEASHETYMRKGRGLFGNPLKLPGANLRGLTLDRMYLFWADLRGVNLRGVYASADFREAILRDANLRDAKVNSADFRYADLRGADLRDAKASASDFAYAQLEGADFRGAKKESTMSTKYAYAVIDGNQSPDQTLFAESCHRSYEAARDAAARGNRAPNSHYYVVEWDAARWAKLRPNEAHCPCDRWNREVQS